MLFVSVDVRRSASWVSCHPSEIGRAGHFVAVGESPLCTDVDKSLCRNVVCRRNSNEPAGTRVRGRIEQLPGIGCADRPAAIGTTDPHTRFHAVTVEVKPGSGTRVSMGHIPRSMREPHVAADLANRDYSAWPIQNKILANRG